MHTQRRPRTISERFKKPLTVSSSKSRAGSLIEVLEQRIAPASGLIVTTTADNGLGSLRQALLDAASNGNSLPESITFAISGPGLVKTIQLATPLPDVSANVFINGYSQSGSSANSLSLGNNATLAIVLDGSLIGGPANGLHLLGNDTVSGLVIQGFQGTTALVGNGILVDGGIGSNTITGNWIGIDQTGLIDKGNAQAGIALRDAGTNNVIGTSAPADRNVISGNLVGIEVTGTGSSVIRNTLISNNFIGTDKSGTEDLGNDTEGVRILGNQNFVTGSIIRENVISGNNGNGITLSNTVPGSNDGNQVLRNMIGSNQAGTANLGNSLAGISIQATSGNAIGNTSGEGNTIAFNGGAGISALSGQFNPIRTNSIYSNSGLGIDLGASGVTLNDAGDGDTGANNLQNFPVIVSAGRTTSVTISGTLSGQSGATYSIDLFSSPTGDSSGYGEGKSYFGTQSATADTAGNLSFTYSTTNPLSQGVVISATATDAAGNTSEFAKFAPLVTDFVWQGSTDTDWFAPSNWFPFGVPGATDSATLNNSTTLNLSSAATVSVFTQVNGTLTGPGALSIGNSFHWSGGTESGTGSTTVFSGGTLSIDTAAAHSLLGRSLTNSGAATWSGGRITLGAGSVFQNFGTFLDTVDERIAWSGSGSGTFNNVGSFIKNSSGIGTFIDSSSVNFNNSGNVTVQSGLLSITSPQSTTTNGSFNIQPGAKLLFDGNRTFTASSSIFGAGDVSFTGGTHLVGGTFNITGTTAFGPSQTVLFESGATVTSLIGPGKTLSQTGGSTDFKATLPSLASNPLSITAGTMNFETNAITVASLVFTSGTLNSNANIDITGLFTWGDTTTISGAGITNANGGTLINGNSGGTSVLANGRTFHNPLGKTVTWSNSGAIGLGTGAIFQNDGAFIAQNDNQLNLFGGGTGTFNNTGTFSKTGGSGSTILNSLSIVFNNTGIVNVQTGTLSVNSPDAGSTSGAFNLSTGTKLNFAANRTFTPSSSIAGAGDVSFLSGTQSFSGTYNVTGTATFTGTSVATFQSGAVITSLLGNGKTLINSGGNTDFIAALPSLASNPLVISGGTMNFENNAVSVPSFVFTAGTFASTATLDINSPFSWIDNTTMSGAGTTNAKAGTTISTNSGTEFLSNGRVFRNPAGQTVTWSGSNSISISGNALFKNEGTFLAQKDGSILTSTGGAFDNSGTFVKTGGTLNTAVGVFNNSGVLNLQSGPLIAQQFTQTAGTTQLNGGILVATTSAATFQGGTLTGAGVVTGDVVNSGGTIQPGGTGSAGTIRVTGNYTQGSGGTLAVELGGATAGTQFDQLNVGGAAALAGTLNVALINGFLPVAGNSFDVLPYGSHTGAFQTLSGDTGFAQNYQAAALSIVRSSLDYVWNGATSADWFNAANWTPRGVPGASDNATISTAPNSVNVSGQNAAIHDLNFGSNTLFGNGALNVAGTMTWTSGEIDLNTNINAGALLNISGSANKLLAGNNAGTTGTLSIAAGATAVWSGSGNIQFQNIAAINNAGLFEAQNNQSFTHISGGISTFTNLTTGTFSKTNSGTTSVPSAVGFINNGAMNTAAGAIIQLGNLTLNDNAKITGSGILRAVGGSLTIAGNIHLNANATLELQTGTQTGTGTFDGAGIFNWTGGSITGQVSIAGGSTMLINGTANKRLNGNNAGSAGILNINSGATVLWQDAGDFEFQNLGTVNNRGTFNVGNNEPISSISGSTALFNNLPGSLFAKTIAGTSLIDNSVNFTNAGTVSSVSGAILDFANLNLANGAAFNGPGLSRVSSGTAKFVTGASVSIGAGAVLELTGSGVLSGAGKIGGAGNLRWSDGTINATVDVAPGSTLLITGAADKLLTGDNAGGTGILNIPATAAVQWSGTGNLKMQNLAAINNAGTFTALNSQSFLHVSGGEERFNNLGSFVKSGAGTTTFGSIVRFLNSGSVTVSTAGASIDFNLLDANDGGLFTGPGISHAIGALKISGANTITAGPALELAGGTLSGIGTFGGNGQFNWSSGTIAGTVTVATGSTMLISSGADKLLNGDNAGGSGILNISPAATVLWSDAGNLRFQNQAVINNSGLFDAQNSQSISNVSGFEGRFNNLANATFIKSGTGTTTFGNAVRLLNSGLVKVATAGASLDVELLNSLGGTFSGPGISRAVGPLLISGTTTIQSGNALELAGGALTGTGTFAGTGRFNWSSGTIFGNVTVASGSTLLLTTAGPKLINGNNAGTAGILMIPSGAIVHWQDASDLRLQNAAIIDNSGTFEVANDQAILSISGGTPVFENRATGIFTKTGAGLTTIQSSVNFHNAGIVNAAAGATIDFATLNLADGARFTGPGLSREASGTLTLENAAVTLASGSTLELTGSAVLAGSGSVGGAGNLNWSGGTVTGALTVAPGSTLLISGSAPKRINGNNAGTAGLLTIPALARVQWSGTGDIELQNLALIDNSGLFIAQNSQSFSFISGGEARFTNQAGGTFVKSGGGTTTFGSNVRFVNSGQINIDTAGALVDFQILDAASNGTFAGPGISRAIGALSIAGNIPLGSGAMLELAGGTLTGTGTFSGPGKFNWSSGTIVGNLTIAGGSTMLISGASDKRLNGNNAGTSGVLTVSPAAAVLWSGAGNVLLQNQAIINNAGLFDAQNSQSFSFLSGGEARFNNLFGATFTKSGSGTTTFGTTVRLVNSGSVNVATAGASLSLQLLDTLDGDAFTGPGISRVLGTLAIAGTSTIGTGAMLELAGGTLTGTGTFAGSGNLNWSSGTITGNPTIAGTMLVTGSGTKLINGNNAGTSGILSIGTGAQLLWTGTGAIGLRNLAIINNAGTFDSQDDQSFNYSSGGAPLFHNLATGTLLKSGGTGGTTFGSTIAVDNAGTIEARTGTLVFTSGLTQSAGVTRLNGGNIATGGTISLQGGTLTGSGTIVGNVSNAATVAPGNNDAGVLNVTGNYTQTSAGTFAVEIGGTTAGTQHDQLNVSGTTTLAGTLNIAYINGFGPGVGQQFKIIASTTNPGTFPNATGQSANLAQSANATGLTISSTLTGQADLALTQTDNITATAPGALLSYNIAYRNDGTLSSSGVQLTETLPAGTTFNPAASTPGWTESTAGSGIYKLSVGTLAVGATGTATFAASVNSPAPSGLAQISATATITDDGRSGAELTPANNTATDSDTLDAAPDLVLTKTDNATTAAPGALVTYTLGYRNDGTQNAAGVVITETLPAGTSFNAAASTQGWQQSSPGVFKLNIGALAGGGAVGSATFAVNVLSPVPAGLEQISSTAVISDDNTNGADLNPANNTATDSDALNASPDLILSMQDSITSTTPGSPLTYTLTYRNAGTQDAAGVKLIQTLPAGTTFNPTASTAGWIETTPGIFTLNAGLLAAGGIGGSAVFALTVNSPAPAGLDHLDTVAQITDDGTNGADLNPADNSATDSNTLTAAPDLVLTISNGVTSLTPGATDSYTLAYRNDGNQNATGVLLSQTLPAGTLFNPGASTAGWNETSPGLFTLSVGALAGIGGNGTAIFAVTISSPAPTGLQSISTTASISDDVANGIDPTPLNNTATDSDLLTGAPDLVLTHSDGLTTAGPGAQLTYTIGYKNEGTRDATGVVLTETLPVGTQFNPAASTNGWIETTPGVFTLQLGNMAGGAAGGTAKFVVNVLSPAAAGLEQLSATATIASDAADLVPTNNSATDSTTLDAAPDLRLSISDDPAVAKRGGITHYTLSYSNHGNQNADGVFLTELLPANSTFLPLESTAGWIEVTPGVFHLPVGSLPAGGTDQSAVFTVKLAPTLPLGYLGITQNASIDDNHANGTDPNGVDNAVMKVTPIYQGVYIVAPGVGVPRGALPIVRVFDIATGTQTMAFSAYEDQYRGGVRIAAGDLNGDGFDDIITATRLGSGRIRVFDGATGTQFSGPFGEIQAFLGRAGHGAFVTSGDVTGDGRDDIIVGSGRGGGVVQIYDGLTGQLVNSYTPFGKAFRGGIRVATGDVNGDGIDDVVLSQGDSGSRIQVYSGATNTILQDFKAAPKSYRSGIFVAAADIDGDGKADIIAGRDINSAAIVEAFSGIDHHSITRIVAFGKSYRNGVRVAATDVNFDGIADIIATSGTRGGSQVKIFDGKTSAELPGFAAFPDFPDVSLFAAATTRVPSSS